MKKINTEGIKSITFSDTLFQNELITLEEYEIESIYQDETTGDYIIDNCDGLVFTAIKLEINYKNKREVTLN